MPLITAGRGKHGVQNEFPDSQECLKKEILSQERKEGRMEEGNKTQKNRKKAISKIMTENNEEKWKI